MNDRIRVIASRAAGLVVGTVCSWLLVRYGIDVAPETRSLLVELVGIAFLAGATYLTTHFAVAVKVNPDDAASPHAAAAGKAKQRQRKHTRKLEENLKEAGLKSREVPSPTPPNSPEIPPHYFGE
jgi:hypothetical protein